VGSLSRPSLAFAPFYMINDLINSGLSKKKRRIPESHSIAALQLYKLIPVTAE
jgi:hypothetical protein